MTSYLVGPRAAGAVPVPGGRAPRPAAGRPRRCATSSTTRAALRLVAATKADKLGRGRGSDRRIGGAGALGRRGPRQGVVPGRAPRRRRASTSCGGPIRGRPRAAGTRPRAAHRTLDTRGQPWTEHGTTDTAGRTSHRAASRRRARPLLALSALKEMTIQQPERAGPRARASTARPA